MEFLNRFRFSLIKKLIFDRFSVNEFPERFEKVSERFYRDSLKFVDSSVSSIASI